MVIGPSFYNYIYWSFKSLGPWVESNEFFPMCIQEISITTQTTKVWEVMIWIPFVLFYLSSPQYLRTLDTSYPVLCMISMTLRTMTPLIITHNLVTPQISWSHLKIIIILKQLNVMYEMQWLNLPVLTLHLITLIVISLVPHFPTTFSSPIIICVHVKVCH